MPSLDSLVVDLQLNSAQLKAGLKEVNEKLDELGKKAKGSHEALNNLSESKSFEIGKELVKGLFEFVEKGAQAAAVVGELAAAAGVATKPFSEMAYAANLSGVSTEDFSAALVKLDKNISLAGGGAIQQSALFRTLGVSLTEAGGHARSTEDVFNQLVDKFAGMEAGAGKTALMLETFGKAGAHLAEFMNQGTHSIAEIRAEAERLGVSLGGETAESAKKFEQAITKLKAVTTGVAMQVAGELAPGLTKLVGSLTSSKDAGSSLHGVVVVLSTAMKVLETVAVVVGGVFESVGLKIALAASLIADAAAGDWKAIKSDFASYGEEMEANAKKLAALGKGIWGGVEEETGNAAAGANVLTAAIAGVGKASLTSGDSLYKAFKHGEEAGTQAKEAVKTLKEQLASMQGEVAAFGLDSFGKLEAEAESGKLSKELARAGAEGAKLKQELLDAAGQLRDMASAKLAIEVDFSIKRGDIATGAANAQRQQQFDNIGKDAQEIRAQAEKGFTSFGDALAQLAKQTHEQASQLGDAQVFKEAMDLDSARKAELLADAAGRAAAKAGKAADAFEEDARRLASMSFGDSLSRAAMGLAGKLGDAGQIIVSGVQGFKDGGIWGAIIAVIGELISRLKVFTDFSDMLNKKLFASLAELNTALEPLFTALTAISDALRPVQVVIHTLIDLVLKALQPAFEGLAQVFGFVGETLKPLGQIFRMLGTAVQPVFKALSALTSFGSVVTAVVDIFQNILPVMQGISAVFKIIGATLNFGTIVIEGIVLGLMRAAQAVMAAFGQNVTAIKNSGDDMEKKLNGSIDQQRKFDLFKDNDPPADPSTFHPATSYNDGQAAAGSIKNLGDAAQKTADKFGELVTNLPSWYKVGAAVFGAVGAVGAAAGAGAAGAGATGGALQGGGSGGLLGTGDMGITVGPDGKPSLRDGLGFNPGDVLGGKEYSKAANSLAGWGNGSGQGTGGDSSSVGSHVGTMTAAESATWAQIWQYSHAMGASDADAAAAADAWITSSRGGTGSSSGAATASSSGVTNIGSGGGGIQSTAPVENHFHFHEGSILARDFGHFVEQVTEKQRQTDGQKSRNPVRTKGRG